MRRKIYRIVSMILAVVLVSTGVPVTAFAEETEAVETVLEDVITDDDQTYPETDTEIIEEAGEVAESDGMIAEDSEIAEDLSDGSEECVYETGYVMAPYEEDYESVDISGDEDFFEVDDFLFAIFDTSKQL